MLNRRGRVSSALAGGLVVGALVVVGGAALVTQIVGDDRPMPRS